MPELPVFYIYLKNMRKHLLSLLLSTIATITASATEPAPESENDSVSIISRINAPGSSITVRQPQSMDKRVSYGSKIAVEAERNASSGRTSRQGGFRVQIFSDNNVHTAKSNAEYRKRSVEQRLPGVRAYLKYESPYWRVRVGDYRTRSEAENALQEIRSAFPNYSSDLKIVSERINITQ